MAGDSVRVDPKGLFDYGTAVLNKVQQSQDQVTKALIAISQNSITAFGTSAGLAGQFTEGLTAMHVVGRNVQDLQAFVKDVATGSVAIQSAATAMAVIYANTDADQANSLNSVDFAFADAGATPPTGFPMKGSSTLFDKEQADEAAAGQNTIAADASQDPTMLQYATGKTPIAGGGGFIYTFADGSKLQMLNANGGSPYISENSSTTSIYRPGDANPTTITSTSTSYDYSGQKTTTTSTKTLVSGDKYSTSEQSTTYLDGGDVLVTTTTDLGNGAPPRVVTTRVTPAPPDPNKSSSDAIQQYETKYHSTGDQQHMKYGDN
jgi:hypothetical protein